MHCLGRCWKMSARSQKEQFPEYLSYVIKQHFALTPCNLTESTGNVNISFRSVYLDFLSHFWRVNTSFLVSKKLCDIYVHLGLMSDKISKNDTTHSNDTRDKYILLHENVLRLLWSGKPFLSVYKAYLFYLTLSIIMKALFCYIQKNNKYHRKKYSA